MTDAADLGNARVVVIRVCDHADPIPAELSTFREFSKRRNEYDRACDGSGLFASSYETQFRARHVRFRAWRPEEFEIDVSLCLAENPFFTERQHETC